MLSPADFLAVLPFSFRPPPTFAPKKVKSRVKFESFQIKFSHFQPLKQPSSWDMYSSN